MKVYMPVCLLLSREEISLQISFLLGWVTQDPLNFSVIMLLEAQQSSTGDIPLQSLGGGLLEGMLLDRQPPLYTEQSFPS